MTEDEFTELAQSLVLPERDIGDAARALQDRLTKPSGSLGLVETLGVQLCLIAGSCPPPEAAPVTIAVFAGDHGVVVEGVTPWPSEVTAQMVANFIAGGAAINVVARHVGAEVVVVDVGVATEIPSASTSLERRSVARGTANLAVGAAMTHEEAIAALSVGVEIANEAIGRGSRLLVCGDMGIGNTTSSAALIAAFVGVTPKMVTGRGTGIDDEMLRVKINVIESALRRVTPQSPPLELLAQVGGFEIAALAGFMIAGAAQRVPVIIDGVISIAAAVVASALAPHVPAYLIAGHRSSEPGATVGLSHLNLTPILDLSLRLGEGTGAALAVPIVQAAGKILREMATFESAAVTGKVSPP